MEIELVYHWFNGLKLDSQQIWWDPEGFRVGIGI